MEEEIEKRLAAQDEILKKIYISSEKTRKYFLATLIVTIVTFVLPLIALIFVIPWFLNTYLGTFSGLGL